LPDTYEAEVAESDRLADDRQAKAKEVAIRDRLITEISQLEQDHAEAAETENARQQEHDQLTDEWHALLAGFYVLPQPPEVILEWHRTFENWLELRTQLLESLSRSRLLEEQVNDFEQQLTLSPATSNQNLDEQLTDVRRRVEEVKTASLEQAQITQALHTDEDGLKDLDNQDDQLNEQQATWSEEWAKLSSTLGFPSDWSARFASKMLQELQDARQKYHESQSATSKADSLEKEVEQFRNEAESICNEVSSDLNEFPLAEIVNRLSDRLSKAIQADRDQVSLQKAKDKTQRRADGLQTELAGLSEKVETLLTSTGVSSSDEFLEAARTAQRQQELLAEQTSLTRNLKRTAGAEDFAGFLDDLTNSTNWTLTRCR